MVRRLVLGRREREARAGWVEEKVRARRLKR